MRTKTAWIGVGVLFGAVAVAVALSATGKAPFLESPYVRIDRGQGKPADFIQICDLAIEDKAVRGGMWARSQQVAKPRVMKLGKPQTVACTARLYDETEASFEVEVFCGKGRGCFIAL